MFKLSNGFLAGLMAVTALVMFATVPAEAKKKRVNSLSLLQGNWKGYGVVNGERVRCNVSYRGRRAHANCRSASASISAGSRLRSDGVGRYSGNWSSGDYYGSIYISRIRRKSHLLTIHASGHGSETLRMTRR